MGKQMQAEIRQLLCFRQGDVVLSANCDRPNIKYCVQRRLSGSGKKNSVADSYSATLLPYFSEVKLKEYVYPKTIFFMKLQWCGFAHELAIMHGVCEKSVAQYHSSILPEVSKYCF